MTLASPSFVSGSRAALHSFASRFRRRHLLLPVILLVHLLLLLALIMSGQSVPQAVARIGSPLSVFDVDSAEERPATPEPPPPPPVVTEIVVPEPVVPLELDVPPLPAKPLFDAAAAAQAGFGTTCDLGVVIGRAFEQNELIRRELGRIGRDSRSVANAIMFWDGDWVDVPGRAPADALNTLRRGILEGVKAAPPECLAEEQIGPRFIAVREAGSTMVLVLGSGSWLWQQIIEDDVAAPEQLSPSGSRPLPLQTGGYVEQPKRTGS